MTGHPSRTGCPSNARALLWIACSVCAACPPFPEDAAYRCTSSSDCNNDQVCGASSRCGPPEGRLDASAPEADAGEVIGPCGISESFDDDFDGSRWALNGTARHGIEAGEGYVRLTNRSEPSTAGTLFFRAKMDAPSFVLDAVFRISTSSIAPDGMSVGWFDAPADALGGVGGGLGYIGLHGYLVEIDQYRNEDDRSDTHVALMYSSGSPSENTDARKTIAEVPIKAITAGTHTLTIGFDEGLAEVWLDGRRVIQESIPDYVPLPVRFGATGGNGFRAGDQDLLDLRVRCGRPDADVFAGNYTHRRRIDLTGLAGTTARIPLPPAAREGSRPDGRDIGVYRGPYVIGAQWEDTAAIETDRAALIVRLPDMSSVAPLYLYYGDAHASSKLTDGAYVFAERFDRRTLPSEWTQHWRLDDPENLFCADRVTGTSSASVCAIDDGLNSRILGLPVIADLAKDPGPGAIYELDAYLGGGFGPPKDLIYVATSPSSGNTRDATLIPRGSYDLAWVPTATLTENENEPTRVVFGFHMPAGSPWRRIRARFLPPADRQALIFRIMSLTPVTSTTTFVELDDVTVRLASEPELHATLGPVETAP